MSSRSPFPGMDPYLERHWPDIHSSLVVYSRDQLQPQLPDDLIARTEERVLLEAEGEMESTMYPDVRVVEYPSGAPATVIVPMKGAESAEPIRISLRTEPATETFVEIREAGSENRVITVIEFLSMSAKTPGKDRKRYRKKQKDLQRGKVSLVEIDLLRAGQRVLVAPQSRIPRHGRTPYQACVRRGWNPDEAEIYPLSLRQPLRAISIPLRQRDAEVHLELQPLIDQCYRNGRYHTINYRVDPEPPLQGDDAVWATELLRQGGKR